MNSDSVSPAGNPPPLPAAPRAKTSGLAVASLVLGLFGFLIVTAVAGLVCGIVAMSRIKRSAGALKGQGVALAGTVISAVMLAMLPVLAILAGMLLPALAKAKYRAQSISCVNNLKQIGLGVRVFAMDHDNKLPLTWQAASNEINVVRLLVCPADGNHRPAVSWATVGPANVTYPFDGAGSADSNPSAIIARCPIHGHVLLGDGSVQQGSFRRLNTRDPLPPPESPNPPK